MIRSDINSPDYLEVKDSSSLKEFGERFLSTPGSKAQLKTRLFVNLLPDEVLARKEDVDVVELWTASVLNSSISARYKNNGRID